MEVFRKTDEELEYEKKKHKEKMESLQKTYVFKRIIPAIEWYLSSPILSILDDTPEEYIKKFLRNSSQYLKIENENIDNLTDLLFEAYFQEEDKKKKNI